MLIIILLCLLLIHFVFAVNKMIEDEEAFQKNLRDSSIAKIKAQAEYMRQYNEKPGNGM